MSRKKRKTRDSTAAAEPQGGEASRRGDLGRWGPFGLFAVLTVYLFREFVVSGGMLFGSDVLALGYFARSFYAEMVRQVHVFPLWNPYIFGGLPFVDAMHGDIFYPTTVMKFVMPVHRAMGWKLVLHVFLAGGFTYYWLRNLGASRLTATFGGTTYMLSPVLVSLIYPGHDGKLFVTALTPLALWVTDRAMVHGGVRRFAVLALVVALLIFTAHMQLAYYTTWAIVVLAVFRLYQARRRGTATRRLAGRLGAFALAGILGGLGIGAAQLWAPTRYLTTYSQRVEKTIAAEAESAYARATSWSLHPEEAFSLVVPEFIGYNPQLGPQAGEERAPTYWGRNPFKLNHEYGGLIPLLLMPLAFLNRRRRGEAWLFGAIAAAALVYALGATTPLFRVFYWLVPGVKLFRAPSSIMFVFGIAVISAAVIGLEGLKEREGEKDWKAASRRASFYLWAAAGVFMLLALLGSTGALLRLWNGIIYPSIDTARLAALQNNLPNIQRGLWLSVLLSASLAGAWQLRARRLIPQAGWLAAIIALSVLDVMRISPQFVRVINPATIYPRDDVTEFLLERREKSEPFRVFSYSQGTAYQANHFAFHGLEELTGHHGNEIGHYMDLIESPGGPRILQLLNVRYLVSARPLSGLEPIFQGRRSAVYELDGAFPRAFLVPAEAAVESEGASALDRLLSPDFDPATSVVLAERPPDPRGFESAAVAENMGVEGGRATWLARGINRQSLEVETLEPALLVISENYYPAWRAEVDGEPTEVLRADYTLRAVPVPAGRHQVTLEYRSPLFRGAVWTSFLSLALAGVLMAGPTFFRRRANGAADRKRTDEA